MGAVAEALPKYTARMTQSRGVARRDVTLDAADGQGAG
jgi:hypothetical protein